MSIKTQIDLHFDHLTLPPPSQGTESPPGRLESSPSHLKTKLEDIYALAKYWQTVNTQSVFCYWARRARLESATALTKRLILSWPPVSISVKWGEKIVEEMGLQLEKNRLHDLMEVPYILITFPLGQIICDNLERSLNYQHSPFESGDRGRLLTEDILGFRGLI